MTLLSGFISPTKPTSPAFRCITRSTTLRQYSRNKIVNMEGQTESALRVIFPVIDMSLLSSGEELHKLRSVLSSCGCFQVLGHGMSDEYLHKVREVTKQFFALPAEEKQKYSRATNDVEGYGEDLVVSKDQAADCCYRLFLKVFPQDQRRLNLWPNNPSDFSEIFNEYAHKIRAVMNDLSKAMARSLNLDENSFLMRFGDRLVTSVRFNFYPPCSKTDVFGAKPHADRSAITVILQDEEVEGLQVLRDGSWYAVPVIPHALVVNLGGLMQIMTNGMFKSPIHRVVSHANKLRMSIAMFDEPEAEREIGPVDELVDERRPRLYKSVKNFATFNYECFQRGKNTLEELLI